MQEEAPGVQHDHAALDALERVAAVVTLLVIGVHARVHEGDLTEFTNVAAGKL